MFNNITYIYCLIDPNSSEIRYIGKTINPKKRLAQHCSSAKNSQTYKSCWIRTLLKDNKKPIIKFLKICSEYSWEYWEKFYIKYYRNEYSFLTNISEGGENSKNSHIKYKSYFHYRTDKIIATNIKTKEEIIFNNLAEVGKAGFNMGTVSYCCKKQRYLKSHKGYQWRYIQDAYMEYESKKYLAIPIIQINMITKETVKFASAYEASKLGFQNKEIKLCCEGKLKQHKGYIWKFANES